MSDPIITCPRCGSTMPAGGRFCMNCGHIMESPAGEPAQEAKASAITEATEQGMLGESMPGESMELSADAATSDEGVAVVSGSIGSSQGADMPDESAPLTIDALPEEPAPPAPPEPVSPAPPESWYESLSASPGGATPTPSESANTDDNTEDNIGAAVFTPDLDPQGEPEMLSTPEEPLAPLPSYENSDASQGSTTYTPPPQWQPGAYDMSATQPVDIPVSAQPSPAPPAGQTQSIFSSPTPPPPAQPPAQGRYTQPIAPQQGYTPPSQAQQTYTPPPAYNSQGLPPGGTQPLQPGQPFPNYQQYQPGYPPPQQAVAPKDPTTALLLELLGFLGFLGIGHIYAGKTNRGIALLIGWIAYLTVSFFLTFCLIGCFMFLAWLFVPPLSGLWLKNEMEKERMTGFRQ